MVLQALKTCLTGQQPLNASCRYWVLIGEPSDRGFGLSLPLALPICKTGCSCCYPPGLCKTLFENSRFLPPSDSVEPVKLGTGRGSRCALWWLFLELHLTGPLHRWSLVVSAPRDLRLLLSRSRPSPCDLGTTESHLSQPPCLSFSSPSSLPLSFVFSITRPPSLHIPSFSFPGFGAWRHDGLASPNP